MANWRFNECMELYDEVAAAQCIIRVAMDIELDPIVDDLEDIDDDITFAVNTLNNQIETNITDFVTELSTDADTAISLVSSSIRAVANDEIMSSGVFTQSVISDIDFLAGQSLTKIVSTAEGITKTFNDNISDTVDDIGSTVSGIDSLISTLTGGVLSTNKSVLEQIDAFASGLLDSIELEVLNITSSVTGLVSELVGDVIGNINLLTKRVGDEVSDLFADFSGAMTFGVDNVLKSITDEIDKQIVLTGQVIDDTSEIVGDVLTDIGALSTSLTETLGDPLGAILTGLHSAWFMEDSETLVKQGRLATDASTDPYDNLARLVNGDLSFKDLLFGDEAESTVFGVLLNVIQWAVATGLLGIQAVNIANTPRIETLLQQVWNSNPTKKYSLPEAITIVNKGFIELEQAKQEAKEAGYDEEHFEQARKSNETPIDVERIAQALRRGFTDEGGYKNALKRASFNEADTQVLRNLVNIHPPVQDLITMAVREVFSPEFVAEFQLFEGLPTEFVNEALKGGLTEDWAEKYWGAHWRLPAANQGFEMFHRGVITSKQLDMLLKALDVSPFWRDKLKAIAYRPITRVDIRRIYKLGLMSKEEVEQRHLYLGYSPDDARKMTEFVVSLITDDEVDDDVDIRSITTSQVKTLYRLGTIDKQYATDKMVEIGYSTDLAILLVGSWETDMQIKERDDLLKLVTAKAIREGLSVDEMEQLIFDLQLTKEEREIMTREILLKGKDFTNIPSKSELKSMALDGIIDYNVWWMSMNQHGYNDDWVSRYAKLWEIPNA